MQLELVFGAPVTGKEQASDYSWLHYHARVHSGSLMDTLNMVVHLTESDCCVCLTGALQTSGAVTGRRTVLVSSA
jgi:hypothetical protein